MKIRTPRKIDGLRNHLTAKIAYDMTADGMVASVIVTRHVFREV